MARSTVKVKISSPGILALLKSEGVRGEIRRRSEPVLSAAINGAPVASGAYRDSLSAVDDTTDRAVVRVGSSVSYAGVVESRTGNLARALDAAGGS